MDGILGLGPSFDWTGIKLAKGSQQDPATLKEVAAQFEALLVTELMKTARESAGGDWFGGGDLASSLPICELAEQQVAQAICLQGGLGLAPLILQGLESKASPAKAE